MKQLVIIAGGLGTRLKARLGDLPKPMIPIAGKPLLAHQVELAKQHGFNEILLCVHYRPDVIREQLGDGARWGVCFTNQTLVAGETREMPVTFYVDREAPKDIGTITLSYTFFDVSKAAGSS